MSSITIPMNHSSSHSEKASLSMPPSPLDDYDSSRDRLLPESRRRPSDDVFSTNGGRSVFLPTSGFCPGLEGLRGVAILMTAVSHFFTSFVLVDPLGYAAVTIFFVLSGYGTMGQLLRIQKTVETDPQSDGWRKELIKMKWNRFKKLQPSMMIMLASMWILNAIRNPVGTSDHCPSATMSRYSLLAATYTYNIRAFWLAPDNPGPFPNAWSLGPTEQLHLLATISAAFFFSKRRSDESRRSILLWATIGSYLLFFIAGAWPSYFPYTHAQFSPFCVMYRFAAGALLRYKQPIPAFLYGSRSVYMGLAIIGLTLWSWSYAPLYQYRTLVPGWADIVRSCTVYGDPFIILGTCLIICGCRTVSSSPRSPAATSSSSSPAVLAVGQVDSRGRNRLLECDTLRFLGKTSYSFYLYQVPVAILSGWPRGWQGASLTCTAFVMATITHFVIEPSLAPFLFGSKKK